MPFGTDPFSQWIIISSLILLSIIVTIIAVSALNGDQAPAVLSAPETELDKR